MFSKRRPVQWHKFNDGGALAIQSIQKVSGMRLMTSGFVGLGSFFGICAAYIASSFAAALVLGPPAYSAEIPFEVAANVPGLTIVAAIAGPEYLACTATQGLSTQFVFDKRSKDLWLVDNARSLRAEVSKKEFLEWVAFRKDLHRKQLAGASSFNNEEHIFESFRRDMKQPSAEKLEAHSIARPSAKSKSDSHRVTEFAVLEQQLQLTRKIISELGADEKYIPQVFQCFFQVTNVPFTARLAEKGTSALVFDRRPLTDGPAWKRFNKTPLWTLFVGDPGLYLALSGK
jgi:hypothetical protein